MAPRGREYELEACECCRERTHGAGVGIALEPARTATVEAAVCSSVRGEVTPSAALKTNEKEVRVRARKSERGYS